MTEIKKLSIDERHRKEFDDMWQDYKDRGFSCSNKIVNSALKEYRTEKKGKKIDQYIEQPQLEFGHLPSGGQLRPAYFDGMSLEDLARIQREYERGAAMVDRLAKRMVHQLKEMR